MHSIDVDFIVPTAYEDFAGFAQIYCGEILFCMERPSVQTSSRKAVFCVRNGSVTPREEGSAKQTHVMLLMRWYAEDVA